MKRKVIRYKLLPTRLPLYQPIVTALVLDRLHASQLVWGIAITFWALTLIAAIVLIFQEEECGLEEISAKTLLRKFKNWQIRRKAPINHS